MEKNSRYAIVGLFVIISFLALSIFVFWLAKFGFDQDKYYTYKTYISHSVDGLKKSSQIFKQGIEIGFVEDINFDLQNSEQIEVILKIYKTVPIKVDDNAILSQKGIAGTSFIDINGGSSSSKLLREIDKNEIATIKSAPSFLSQMTQKVTSMVDKFSNIISKLDESIDNENVKKVNLTIDNLYKITSNLENQKNHIESILKNSNTSVAEFQIAIKKTNDLIDNANILTVQAKNTLSKIDDQNLTTKIDKTILQLQETIDETKKSVQEIKETTINAQHLIQSIEESPSDLLFKSKNKPLGPGE